MNTHESRLIDEYTSAGNDALLLARLEREHHQMLAEMREAGHDVSISEMSAMMHDLKWAFLEKHTRKNERGA